MTPGFHPEIPLEHYLKLEALGSSRLGNMAVSPLYYKHSLTQPREETDSTELGSAVHALVLEPERFGEWYVPEPDLEAIGGAKPRATKAYKEQVEVLEAEGARVLRGDVMAKVRAMAAAVLAHPHAAALLAKATEREVTLLWERDGRLCKARPDAMGEGVIGELKTTRTLKYFSPFEVTRLGYYRRAVWYLDGAQRLGCPKKHFVFIAVESSAPYDVGVFALADDARLFGQMECDQLLERLAECERSGEWPGQFPEVQPATVTDAFAAMMSGQFEEAV